MHLDLDEQPFSLRGQLLLDDDTLAFTPSVCPCQRPTEIRLFFRPPLADLRRSLVSVAAGRNKEVGSEWQLSSRLHTIEPGPRPTSQL